MGTIWLDLRHACRMLGSRPMFAAAAVLTLALGIGANTAIFSVVEKLVLRPLPYADPSTLVQLWNTYPPTIAQGPNSAGDFRDFRKQSRTFSEMGAYVEPSKGVNLTREGEPARLEMRYATSCLFPMLGIRPVVGRGFTSAEDNPGMPLTVLISNRLWRRRFGGSPEVLGRTVTLDERGYTVVGVLPEELRLDPETDLWMPRGQYDAGPDPYRYHEFLIVGRLKPGVRLDQAQAELSALNAQQQKAFPDTHRNFRVEITPMQDGVARKMRTALLILLGAVSLVLLVACANFVNLLMARYAARQREFAARVALGASTGRLLSHLLTESILLAVLGGACGVVLAMAGLRAIHVLVPPDLAGIREAGLNFRVLALTLSLSLLAGIGCGLIPAFHVARPGGYDFLKDGARTTGSRGRQAVRRLLAVSEIALAVILLAGAGLLIRSLRRVMEVDPGFQPHHVLALEADRAQLSPAEQNQMTLERRIAYLRQQSIEYEELMRRIEALPGVRAAGGVSVLPLGTAMRSASRFLLEGQTAPANGARPVAETRSVSVDYFAAMGIPLRQGRLLDAHDYATQNVVINQKFAERFWPRGDAVGKRFNFCSLGPSPCWTTVVGVVGNVHQYGLEAAPTFDSYSATGWEPHTLIRTASDPESVARAVSAEIRKFDPALPVTRVTTLDNLLEESVGSRRLSTILLGLFGGLAMLLATIGVYAVMSYAVRMRTNEIGVRMALGARPGQIWWLVLDSGVRLVAAGMAIGIAGAFALTKLLAALLYEVTPTDPITFGAVALLLGGVALLACYMPARQAMRIEPMAALRTE